MYGIGAYNGLWAFIVVALEASLAQNMCDSKT